MREQIRKRIKNDDLFEGCRVAFRNNYESVKLYFLCGLPGERPVDLDGIIEMSETIARIGKEERGRYARVTASVSNFVPKAAHAVPVERHADARVFPLGARLPLASEVAAMRADQAARHRNEPARRTS